jgi:hypothetical protein
MKDLGLNSGLANLERLRQKLVAITDRFSKVEKFREMTSHNGRLDARK